MGCRRRATAFADRLLPATYICYHDRREGENPEEIRGRDPTARPRAEDRASEGDQARARAGRSSRERGVSGGEGTPATGRIAHQPSAETRERDLADESRPAAEGQGRLRVDGHAARRNGTDGRLSAGHARRRQRRGGADLDRPADRPRGPE